MYLRYSMSHIKSMEILGVKIDNLTMEKALQKIEGFLENGQQHYIVLPYSEFIVQANKDKYFCEIINRADLSLCDGRGLFFALRFLGQPIKEQILGVELIKELCQRYPKIFLFGAKEEVVKKMACLFDQNIIGFIDGYQDGKKVIKEINQAQPEIILVALGMPKQEKWIVQNLRKMPSVKLAMGVGGAFDFMAGRIRRAPKLFQRLGLEWLWRLFCQPWRAKRIFRAVVKFPWLVIKNK